MLAAGTVPAFDYCGAQGSEFPLRERLQEKTISFHQITGCSVHVPFIQV